MRVHRVKPVQNARLSQAIGDGFGTVQANNPDIGAAQTAQGRLEDLI